MKKYSSTPRLINLIVFAILTAGFGAMAIYFTFLIAPWTWSQVKFAPVSVDRENISLALYLMFGSLGVAGTVLSLLGLLKSIAAFRKTDDESVRRCFDYYFSLGYVVATALFCNAGWLILLTTKNFSANLSVAFVVVVYVVALILVLVGTNIPLVKVYEDDDEGVGMGRILLSASAATGCGIAVTMLYSGIITAALNDGTAATMLVYLTRYLILGFVALLGCLIAFLGLRTHKKGNGKLASILLYASLGVYGLGMIGAGIMQTVVAEGPKVWKNSGSFMGTDFAVTHNTTNMVLSYVFGAIVVIAAIALICVTLMPKKKK